MSTSKSYEVFRQEQLKHRPNLGKLLDKQSSVSLRIANALTSMRRSAGLSQRDLAKTTGWKQPYVARLETLSENNVPSLETIARYVEACGLEVGLSFYEKKSKDDSAFKIKEAVAITNDAQLLEYLENLVNKSER